MLADRRAAGGHEQIGAGGAGGHAAQRGALVGRDAEHDRIAADRRHERAQRQRVRADDLIGADRIAGTHDLVAGREDGDARPPAHAQPRMVHRRRETDIARGQTAAGLDADRADGEVEAGRPNVGAHGDTLAHRHAVAVLIGVLLDHDGVGAARHRSAGEDPHRVARTDLAVEVRSRGHRAGAPQGRGHARDVGGAHRPAVHRRHGGRRLGDARTHVLGEHAAEASGQQDVLGRDRRTLGESRDDAAERLLDRDHGWLQVPERPPALWVNRMSPMRMPRSTALHMS